MNPGKRIILLLLIGALPAAAQTINLSPSGIGWDAGTVTLNESYPILDMSSAENQVELTVDMGGWTDFIILIHHDLNWCNEVELHASLTHRGRGQTVNESVGTAIEITTTPKQFLSGRRKVNRAEIQYRLYSWDQMPEVGDHSTTVTYTVQEQ